jgi:hypothetical protein
MKPLSPLASAISRSNKRRIGRVILPATHQTVAQSHRVDLVTATTGWHELTVVAQKVSCRRTCKYALRAGNAENIDDQNKTSRCDQYFVVGNRKPCSRAGGSRTASRSAARGLRQEPRYRARIFRAIYRHAGKFNGVACSGRPLSAARG